MISLEEVAHVMIEAYERPESWLTESDIYRDLYEAKVRIMTEEEKDEYVANTNLILEKIEKYLDEWTAKEKAPAKRKERYAVERDRDLSEEELDERVGKIELPEYRLTEHGYNALKAECAKEDMPVNPPEIADLTPIEGLPDINNPLQ
ncbi:MAG: hypothetical protein V1743_03195 [Nanoarchaeota archaeon]